MNVISKHLDQSMHSHIGGIYLVFFHCAFLMCPQMACLRGYIVALIAFIWLFSAVRFQMSPQISCVSGCIITSVAFDFSKLCVFRCILKWPASEDAKSHWLRLLGLCPLCIFICVLNLSAREYVKSHWLHLFDFSPLCVFKCLYDKMNSYIDCICLTFLHCAFSNESSTCLYEKMHSYTACICLAFLHCAFSDVSSTCLPEKM